jgi:hypothetical protein
MVSNYIITKLFLAIALFMIATEWVNVEKDVATYKSVVYVDLDSGTTRICTDISLDGQVHCRHLSYIQES